MARDVSTREAVCAAIRARHAEEKELALFVVAKAEPELLKAAERFFRGRCAWGDAVQAAGLPLSATYTTRLEIPIAKQKRRKRCRK